MKTHKKPSVFRLSKSQVFILFLLFLGSSSFPLQAENFFKSLGDKLPSKDQVSHVFNKFNDLVAGHLEIGTRVTGFHLKKAKGDFIGSVDHLDASQDSKPDRIFVDWLFTPKWGIELTWDKLAADTVTRSDGHNDGQLIANGPIFTVFRRFPNETRFVPYVGLGIAFFNRVRVTKGWWHYGFFGRPWQVAESRFVDWRASGSPSWPNGGMGRNFELDESEGFVFTSGCSAELSEKWAADLYFRYTDVSFDNDFTLTNFGIPNRLIESEFDLSNYAFGVGIKYVF